MDNFGFQQDVEEASFSLSENSNNEDIRHWPKSSQLLSRNDGCYGNEKEANTQQRKITPNANSPKLSSSSLKLPKNRTSNKYRRFSESFSYASRVPYCVGKMLNIPSRENVKHNAKCSSFVISDSNNVSKSASDSIATCHQHSHEGGGYIEVRCNSSNPALPDVYQPNNMRLCSLQNFQGQNSVSSLLNNVQECSNHASVPSLSLNNSYHEGYVSSVPSFSKSSLSLSPSFSNKQNLVCDTSLDIRNTVAQPLKSTNKYSNLSPGRTSLNNAQYSENSLRSLTMKQRQFSEGGGDLNTLPCIMKKQKNVNHVLNRATTLPPVTIKNERNQIREFTSVIPTVSGAVPMYYSAFPNPQPSSANRENLKRPSKVLSAVRGATLKKRKILRGWKLHFIPSDHSKRRAVALCCALLLACVLALVTTGLVIYMTTGQCTHFFKFFNAITFRCI
jgi:hypothetical protein